MHSKYFDPPLPLAVQYSVIICTAKWKFAVIYTNTHTYTHTNIYLYMMGWLKSLVTLHQTKLLHWNSAQQPGGGMTVSPVISQTNISTQCDTIVQTPL